MRKIFRMTVWALCGAMVFNQVEFYDALGRAVARSPAQTGTLSSWMDIASVFSPDLGEVRHTVLFVGERQTVEPVFTRVLGLCQLDKNLPVAETRLDDLLAGSSAQVVQRLLAAGSVFVNSRAQMERILARIADQPAQTRREAGRRIFLVTGSAGYEAWDAFPEYDARNPAAVQEGEYRAGLVALGLAMRLVQTGRLGGLELNERQLRSVQSAAMPLDKAFAAWCRTGVLAGAEDVRVKPGMAARYRDPEAMKPVFSAPAVSAWDATSPQDADAARIESAARQLANLPSAAAIAPAQAAATKRQGLLASIADVRAKAPAGLAQAQPSAEADLARGLEVLTNRPLAETEPFAPFECCGKTVRLLENDVQGDWGRIVQYQVLENGRWRQAMLLELRDGIDPIRLPLEEVSRIQRTIETSPAGSLFVACRGVNRETLSFLNAIPGGRTLAMLRNDALPAARATAPISSWRWFARWVHRRLFCTGATAYPVSGAMARGLKRALMGFAPATPGGELPGWRWMVEKVLVGDTPHADLVREIYRQQPEMYARLSAPGGEQDIRGLVDGYRQGLAQYNKGYMTPADFESLHAKTASIIDRAALQLGATGQVRSLDAIIAEIGALAGDFEKTCPQASVVSGSLIRFRDALRGAATLEDARRVIRQFWEPEVATRVGDGAVANFWTAVRRQQLATMRHSFEYLRTVLPGLFAVADACWQRVPAAQARVRLRPEQLIAAIDMADLYVAQLRTGEGKTEMSAPVVALFALMGMQVPVYHHDETDARKSYENNRAVLEAMGFSVGLRQESQKPAEAGENLSREIVYLSGDRAGFDYLNGLFGGPLAFPVAVMDEWDLTGPDKIRVPLILATGEAGEQTPYDLYEVSALLADVLVEATDYTIDVSGGRMQVVWTEAGLAKMEKWFPGSAPVRIGQADAGWEDAGHPLFPVYNALKQAVTARHLVCGDDYGLRADGRGGLCVALSDKFTGVFTERQFDDGLQQAIQAKERLRNAGVRLDAETFTVEYLTPFEFLRQAHLAHTGMTGTAKTEEDTALAMGLSGVKAEPSHFPRNLRQVGETAYYGRGAPKMRDMLDEVRAMIRAGRPVEVALNTDEEVEQFAALLSAQGIWFQTIMGADSPAEFARKAGVAGLPVAPGAAEYADAPVTITNERGSRALNIVPGGSLEAIADLILIRSGVTNPRLAGVAAREAALAQAAVLQPVLRRRVVEAGNLHVTIGCAKRLTRLLLQAMGRTDRNGTGGTFSVFISMDETVFNTVLDREVFKKLGRLYEDPATRGLFPDGRWTSPQAVGQAARAVAELRGVGNRENLGTIERDQRWDSARSLVSRTFRQRAGGLGQGERMLELRVRVGRELAADSAAAGATPVSAVNAVFERYPGLSASLLEGDLVRRMGSVSGEHAQAAAVLERLNVVRGIARSQNFGRGESERLARALEITGEVNAQTVNAAFVSLLVRSVCAGEELRRALLLPQMSVRMARQGVGALLQAAAQGDPALEGLAVKTHKNHDGVVARKRAKAAAAAAPGAAREYLSPDLYDVVIGPGRVDYVLHAEAGAAEIRPAPRDEILAALWWSLQEEYRAATRNPDFVFAGEADFIRALRLSDGVTLRRADGTPVVLHVGTETTLAALTLSAECTLTTGLGLQTRVEGLRVELAPEGWLTRAPVDVSTKAGERYRIEAGAWIDPFSGILIAGVKNGRMILSLAGNAETRPGEAPRTDKTDVTLQERDAQTLWMTGTVEVLGGRDLVFGALGARVKVGQGGWGWPLLRWGEGSRLVGRATDSGVLLVPEEGAAFDAVTGPAAREQVDLYERAMVRQAVRNGHGMFLVRARNERLAFHPSDANMAENEFNGKILAAGEELLASATMLASMDFIAGRAETGPQTDYKPVVRALEGALQAVSADLDAAASVPARARVLAHPILSAAAVEGLGSTHASVSRWQTPVTLLVLTGVVMGGVAMALPSTANAQGLTPGTATATPMPTATPEVSPNTTGPIVVAWSDGDASQLSQQESAAAAQSTADMEAQTASQGSYTNNTWATSGSAVNSKAYYLNGPQVPAGIDSVSVIDGVVGINPANQYFAAFADSYKADAGNPWNLSGGMTMRFFVQRYDTKLCRGIVATFTDASGKQKTIGLTDVAAGQPIDQTQWHTVTVTAAQLSGLDVAHITAIDFLPDYAQVSGSGTTILTGRTTIKLSGPFMSPANRLGDEYQKNYYPEIPAEGAVVRTVTQPVSATSVGAWMPDATKAAQQYASTVVYGDGAYPYMHNTGNVVLQNGAVAPGSFYGAYQPASINGGAGLEFSIRPSDNLKTLRVRIEDVNGSTHYQFVDLKGMTPGQWNRFILTGADLGSPLINVAKIASISFIPTEATGASFWFDVSSGTFDSPLYATRQIAAAPYSGQPRTVVTSGANPFFLRHSLLSTVEREADGSIRWAGVSAWDGVTVPTTPEQFTAAVNASGGVYRFVFEMPDADGQPGAATIPMQIAFTDSRFPQSDGTGQTTFDNVTAVRSESGQYEIAVPASLLATMFQQSGGKLANPAAITGVNISLRDTAPGDRVLVMQNPTDSTQPVYNLYAGTLAPATGATSGFSHVTGTQVSGTSNQATPGAAVYNDNPGAAVPGVRVDVTTLDPGSYAGVWDTVVLDGQGNVVINLQQNGLVAKIYRALLPMVASNATAGQTTTSAGGDAVTDLQTRIDTYGAVMVTFTDPNTKASYPVAIPLDAFGALKNPAAPMALTFNPSAFGIPISRGVQLRMAINVQPPKAKALPAGTLRAPDLGTRLDPYANPYPVAMTGALPDAYSTLTGTAGASGPMTVTTISGQTADEGYMPFATADGTGKYPQVVRLSGTLPPTFYAAYYGYNVSSVRFSADGKLVLPFDLRTWSSGLSLSVTLKDASDQVITVLRVNPAEGVTRGDIEKALSDLGLTTDAVKNFSVSINNLTDSDQSFTIYLVPFVQSGTADLGTESAGQTALNSAA